jgi:hypothetical protein
MGNVSKIFSNSATVLAPKFWLLFAEIRMGFMVDDMALQQYYAASMVWPSTRCYTI